MTTTTLFDTIQSHIKDFESQLYTSCPAIVDSYDPSECTVNVTPQVLRAETDGLLIKDQLLIRVPLHFQATQELGITFPIRKGDTVLLVFGQSDIENWSLDRNSNPVIPKTLRHHNINDAFAIAGVFKYDRTPVQSGTEEDLNIRYKDTFVRLKQNGDVEVYSPTKISLNVGNNSTIVMDNDGIVMNAPRIDLN